MIDSRPVQVKPAHDVCFFFFFIRFSAGLGSMDYGKDTLNYTLRKIWSIQLVSVTTKKIGSMLRLPGKTVQKIETFPKKKNSP